MPAGPVNLDETYWGLANPNPGAKVNGDGTYWGRQHRRDTPSGVVVLHTTEGALDESPPDYGAESTARYFGHSTRPASYHDLVDSDSEVPFLPYDHEAFHDATGTNPHSIGVSAGRPAASWGRNPAHDEATLRRMARRGARALRWVAGQKRLAAVPAEWVRHLTVAEARARVPGFIAHGELDPSRRSDPWVTHPMARELWGRFLAAVNDELYGGPVPGPDDEELTVAQIEQILAELAKVQATQSQQGQAIAALASHAAKWEQDTRKLLGRQPFRIGSAPDVYYLADGDGGGPVKVHVPSLAVKSWLQRTGHLDSVPEQFEVVGDPAVVAWLEGLPTVRF